jgi:hypothetical protein
LKKEAESLPRRQVFPFKAATPVPNIFKEGSLGSVAPGTALVSSPMNGIAEHSSAGFPFTNHCHYLPFVHFGE